MSPRRRRRRSRDRLVPPDPRPAAPHVARPARSPALALLLTAALGGVAAAQEGDDGRRKRLPRPDSEACCIQYVYTYQAPNGEEINVYFKQEGDLYQGTCIPDGGLVPGQCEGSAVAFDARPVADPRVRLVAFPGVGQDGNGGTDDPAAEDGKEDVKAAGAIRPQDLPASVPEFGDLLERTLVATYEDKSVGEPVLDPAPLLVKLPAEKEGEFVRVALFQDLVKLDRGPAVPLLHGVEVTSGFRGAEEDQFLDLSAGAGGPGAVVQKLGERKEPGAEKPGTRLYRLTVTLDAVVGRPVGDEDEPATAFRVRTAQRFYVLTRTPLREPAGKN